MSIEHKGARPSGWTPAVGTVNGTLITAAWPVKSGVFHDTHKASVQPCKQYHLLTQELFAHQLPDGTMVQSSGDQLIDRLSKDINSCFNYIAVLADQYSRVRRQIADHIRALVLSKTPLKLSEEEVFGFVAYNQGAISGLVSYTDLLGKHLYLLLFRQVPGVDENTGFRKRSYFREFKGIFYDPTTKSVGTPSPALGNIFLSHDAWFEEIVRLRDFFQHAGVVNPILWQRGGDFHIDFTGAIHNPPLPQGAFLDSVQVGRALETLNDFNEDVKKFISQFCGGIGK